MVSSPAAASSPACARALAESSSPRKEAPKAADPSASATSGEAQARGGRCGDLGPAEDLRVGPPQRVPVEAALVVAEGIHPPSCIRSNDEAPGTVSGCEEGMPVTAAAEMAGSARLVVVDVATLLHPEAAVFEAILAGWRLQQESRLLAAPTVAAGTRRCAAGEILEPVARRAAESANARVLEPGVAGIGQAMALGRRSYLTHAVVGGARAAVSADVRHRRVVGAAPDSRMAGQGERWPATGCASGCCWSPRGPGSTNSTWSRRRRA